MIVLCIDDYFVWYKKIISPVDSIMTETYRTIGKYIVEFEQAGNVKSVYGCMVKVA